jgi:TonB family protein
MMELRDVPAVRLSKEVAMSSSRTAALAPQSWEHLFDRDPSSAVGFRVGVAAALLIHAAVFAVTWPTIAQAPPADPEPLLIRFPITNLRPVDPPPEPVLREVPLAQRSSGPPIVSVPPEHDPISALAIEELPPLGATTWVAPPIVAPPPEIAAPTSEPVLVGGKVAAPEVVFRVEPRYTEPARRAGIQGVVILDLVIGTGGSVESVAVLRGLPLGLTESATDAVEQWRFAPSTLDDLPVRVRYILTVRFTLE